VFLRTGILDGPKKAEQLYWKEAQCLQSKTKKSFNGLIVNYCEYCMRTGYSLSYFALKMENAGRPQHGVIKHKY
jgi:hypothetical protein